MPFPLLGLVGPSFLGRVGLLSRGEGLLGLKVGPSGWALPSWGKGWPFFLLGRGWPFLLGVEVKLGFSGRGGRGRVCVCGCGCGFFCLIVFFFKKSLKSLKSFRSKLPRTRRGVFSF